jgi:hypothetical protein
MNKSTFFVLIAAISGSFVFLSCEKEDHENETKISSFDSTESHKAGQDCMICHKSGGSGEGWFTVAGTLYDSTKMVPFPNANIKLFTGPDGTGTLKMTIQVDGRGNFYTTESIDFEDGLYTLAEGRLGAQNMHTSFTSGACNSCHGNSTDRIWVK